MITEKLKRSKQLSLIFNESAEILEIFSSSEKYIFDINAVEIQEINHFLDTYSGHIFVYDLKGVYKKLKPLNIYLPKTTLDVMLGSFVENSSFPIDLNKLIERKLGQVAIEDTQALISDSSENEISEVELIYTLGSKFLEELDGKRLYLWQNIESPLAIILAEMELRGVYIDREKLVEIAKELRRECSNLESKILAEFAEPGLNIGSTKQLSEALIKKGFQLGKPGSKGNVSTDRNVLEELEKTDETGLISMILEYRTVSKLQSTYTQTILDALDENDRLHGVYNQVQAATGRLSSNSPNLQNIPIRNPKYGPLFRSSFAAPSGRLLIKADYSQIELRLLAHFSGDETLIDAFKANQDIHTRTASEIFELPLDQVTKAQRSLGKTLNFALVYQQGAFATARQLGINQKQATEFINKYFARFPRVKPFIEESLGKAKEVGYAETLYGRRRYFANLNSTNGFVRKIDERASFNAILQGSNADIIKIAMLSITQKFKEQNVDAFIILQVHDELVLEVAENQAEEARKILITEMELGQPLKVPILVESGIGKNWAEC